MEKTVILADGSFPEHEIPLGYLKDAERIICCDGSAESLILAGYEPFAIVGDMDSLSAEMANRYADRIYQDNEQETNDLTKAVTWCKESGFDNIIIVGATGKREDHTLGNISLLAEYCEYVKIMLISDYGYFIPFNKSCRLDTFHGQQVSVFSINPETEITSSGLKYQLNGKKIKNWWEATLNEATGDSIELSFTDGRIIVFLKF